MKRISFAIFHLSCSVALTVLATVLLSACANDDAPGEESLPEGMGRIRLTMCTPDVAVTTRAVGDPAWENPDHDWESLQTFRVLFCTKVQNANRYKVVKSIGQATGDPVEVTHTPDANAGTQKSTTYTHKEYTIESGDLEAGTYFIFAVGNLASYADYGVGQVIDPDVSVKYANGYSETNIPMTGMLTNDNGLMPVPVNNGIVTDLTDPDFMDPDEPTPLRVWRVMAKMQFEFTNESAEKVDILGIEVEPINQIATGDDAGKGLIYLFSKDDLTSTANLAANGGVTLPTTGVTTGTVRYQPTQFDDNGQPIASTIPLKLNGYNGTGTKPTGTIFFYVNETDATYTTTNNQLSLRFKIQRGGTTQEIRYGVTTHYGDGSTGQNGFNVIRRNDWIHIPVVLTDWQFRIEPLAFVPIAGYPAKTLSSNGLTATFSTGGMIALQPFVKKYSDATWRNFGDPEIAFVSVHWKNSDGEDIAYFNSDGTLKDGANANYDASSNKLIVKTAFAYDPVTKCIIGELDNNLAGSGGDKKTTFTVNVDLEGPTDTSTNVTSWYHYTFTFNVILQ